jgi:DNA-binding NtrC family response regulator
LDGKTAINGRKMKELDCLRYPQAPILIVDDEPMELNLCRDILHSSGLTNAICLSDSRDVMPLLSRGPISVMLLDLDMPHITGEELLAKVSQEYPGIQVIIVTANRDIDVAVRCIKNKAFYYVVKPIKRDRILPVVRRAIELTETQEHCESLTERILSGKLQHSEVFSDVVTCDPGMHAIFEYVEAIAPSFKPVLIFGETGVGKELIARAIHRISGRRGGFVPVNVAGLDDHLFSDTLFGHKKGAFTGASSSRDGLIESAQGGTLFLDEIGDLAAQSQVRLLRLLQEREYFPLGSDRPKFTDCRIVAATNKNLETMKESGEFRKDLYYRLRTHRVRIPPLRERKADLPLLLDHFLRKASASLGKPKPTPPEELITLLASYDFPGNVRELEEMVFDAVCKHKSKKLSLDAFKSSILVNSITDTGFPEPLGREERLLFPAAGESAPLTIKEATDLLVLNAMVKSKGNQSLAAEMLGISRPALHKRLKRSGLRGE